jgi:hypothetical protein
LPCTHTCSQAELSARYVGKASTLLEGVAVLLDPRFKNKRLTMFADEERGALAARRELISRYRSMEQAHGAQAAADVAAAAQPKVNLIEHQNKRARHLSYQDKRAAQRAEQAVADAAAAVVAATVGAVNEVHTYLAEPVLPWAEDFDLLDYWSSQSASDRFPNLARVAAQVLAVESSSCQAERNFSTLAHVLSSMRASLAPWKVDLLMFLRCNRHLIPEYAAVLATRERLAAARAAAAQAVQAAQGVPLAAAAIV